MVVSDHTLPQDVLIAAALPLLELDQASRTLKRGGVLSVAEVTRRVLRYVHVVVLEKGIPRWKCCQLVVQ